MFVADTVTTLFLFIKCPFDCNLQLKFTMSAQVKNSSLMQNKHIYTLLLNNLEYLNFFVKWNDCLFVIFQRYIEAERAFEDVLKIDKQCADAEQELHAVRIRHLLVRQRFDFT